MAAPMYKSISRLAILRKIYQHGNTHTFCLSQHGYAGLRFTSSESHSKGLVLGCYEPQEDGGSFILTPTAKKFDEATGGKLTSHLKIAGRKFKCGKSRVLYGLDGTYQTVAITNLGKQDAGFDVSEQLDQAKENVRTAVASGLLQLRDVGESQVSVDPCGDAEAAAEGGSLALYYYDALRAEKSRKPKVDITCFSQNYKEDKSWAESMKMGAFLSVAKGSVEPPVFLEIDYKGGKENDPPAALVGKGVTFDSGGISLKPAGDMDKMRADMGGAACVAGAILGGIKLGLPVNIKGFIPLCENMPSGSATKPGDVITAMNGKTIQIDNTDAEGRLILIDALCYAETFKPKLIVDLATLTGAIMVALGGAAAGGFTKSQALWDLLSEAGGVTGDRIWRMPLYKHYTKQMSDSALADFNNVAGAGRGGGSCTAAALLQAFTTTEKWIHLDIAGVMENKNDVPYMSSGMTGRPTRTLIKFLENVGNTKL